MLGSSYVQPALERMTYARDVGTDLPPSPQASSESERELVLRHIGFAEAIARRYTGRVGDQRDIRQVALLGLVKAAKRFDPDRGFEFTAFAGPTIAGEIKRYLRDTAWAVRPPRAVQELSMAIGTAVADLQQLMGREPTHDEIADHLSRDVPDIAEALAGSRGMFAAPLDDLSETHIAIVAERSDPAEIVERQCDLNRALQRLSQRDRIMLYLRYFEGRSQREISTALGMSQMQVSRAMAKVLRDLHGLLETPESQATLREAV